MMRDYISEIQEMYSRDGGKIIYNGRLLVYIRSDDFDFINEVARTLRYHMDIPLRLEHSKKYNYRLIFDEIGIVRIKRLGLNI